ncbi:B-cell receptor-associated protein 31 [Manduca sexta]|uniref:B-cell receptor-associated protein 31 n=1 Tax=Manduca sexta TaxID=7130 RepID=UPI0011830C63|nr:B-cell receptor-associated protein 31 [Manduca sexta]
MSIQWTFVAGYLYFEIALVALMILPIISPRWWHQFFRSRLFAIFKSNAVFYFCFFLAFLGMLLIDAIREMRKYSHSTDSGQNLANELKNNVKLFRAQRNFYITGFAIFLTFVIRRLVTMLIIQDELSIKAENIIKQAEATVKEAKSTILANTLQGNNQTKEHDLLKARLEVTKNDLQAEQEKTQQLQEEVDKWRAKYLEITNGNESSDYE